MKQHLRTCICTILLLLGSASNAEEAMDVIMVTSEGTVEIELYADKAPLTVKNFLQYVDGEYLDGGSFYRVVTYDNDKGNPKIEVIQGGMGDVESPFEPVAHESTEDTGILHTDGVISMARGAVGTASSEFFICIGEQPGLDFGAARNPDEQGFAAFGKVISGMNVIRKINMLPANTPTESEYTRGQILDAPVVILSVRRK